MNLAAIKASEATSSNDNKPKIQEPDTVINFTARLITKALKNEHWRIDLKYGQDKSISFDTGKAAQRPKYESKDIELTYDEKGIYLHCQSSIRSFYYADLNFDYNNQLVQMLNWFHAEVLSHDSQHWLKTNQFQNHIQLILNKNGYNKYTVTVSNYVGILHVYVSGNMEPIAFKILDNESYFGLLHVKTDMRFELSYFDLLENEVSAELEYCGFLVDTVNNDINYEHQGYEVIGFYQDQSSWYMSYRFLNEVVEFTHIIQAKTKEADLLRNIFPIFMHYSDYSYDSIDRHETTTLAMLSYNQVLGLNNTVIDDATLIFSYSAPNPLIHPEEVLRTALLEFVKPITDLIIKHI